jgi:5'-phosphate synthase pdxT subunit
VHWRDEGLGRGIDGCRLDAADARLVNAMPLIGVLAIQGDFDAHRRRLEELGAKTRLVRKPEELDGLDGIIIPGGESSTMLKFLEHGGFFEMLRDFVRVKPSFGTCAGAILLAKDVENPRQTSLGALDISVRRNAYGRQLESHIVDSDANGNGKSFEMVFIRAPKISRIGKGVEVLAKSQSEPVWVRQGCTMAATFHPELSDEAHVHREFLKMVEQAK